jgi:O-antigen/teichoic acid export membrane protein
VITGATPDRLRSLATTLRGSRTVRGIARTAGFNVAATAAAGLGGIIVARTVGPAVRGEYAAIMAWLGVAITVGCLGLPTALCFYVAREPAGAHEYVATSRALVLTTGTVALGAGMLLAPILGRGSTSVTLGYRIAFGTILVAFLAVNYTAALQGRDLRRWNISRLSQPVLSLAAVGVLWRLRLLTLDTVLAATAATLLLQFCWAYRSCQRSGLVPGHARMVLVRPMATYGMAQIAATTPAVLNTHLDQLVLSQTVPPADLGRYAVAVSLSLVSGPAVSAIGNVAFPWLASQRQVSDENRRLQLLAVLGSAALATAVLLPLAVASYWLVPLVFGASYRGAVPLLWVLTPGAIFLVCGQVAGDLLRGMNRPIVVAWAEGLAVIFTIGLLLALLPVMGVYAAALASTVAYGVAFGVMLGYLLQPARSSRQ